MPHSGQLSHRLPLLLPPERIGQQKCRELSMGIGTLVHHPARGINLYADHVPLDPVGLEGRGDASVQPSRVPPVLTAERLPYFFLYSMSPFFSAQSIFSPAFTPGPDTFSSFSSAWERDTRPPLRTR